MKEKKLFKYTVVIVFLICLNPCKVGAETIDVKYVNPRYGFSIEYPDSFKEKSESDNGDGITLTNREKGLELIVYGANNVFEMTPREAYEEARSQVNNPIYAYSEGNWYVLSWIEAGKVLYTKAVVGPGSINAFRVTYPVQDQGFYEELIYKLTKSFQTPSIDKMN